MSKFYIFVSILYCILTLSACKTTETSNVTLQTKKSLTKYVINNDYNIGETYLNNIGDVNQDGIDDFVVSFMLNPQGYGLKFWDVTYKQHLALPKPPSYLYYSVASGEYDLAQLPESVSSLRMWAVKSFEQGGKQYLILGRNGELGTPDQIPGEQNALVEYKFVDGKPVFNEPIFEEQKSTTADIALFEYDNRIQILFSNYNSFVKTPLPSQKFSSVIRNFSSNGFDYSNISPRTVNNSAMNSIKIIDIDHDGKLDAMMAAEVYTFGTKTPRSGSYLILDFLNSGLDIEPSDYKWDPIFISPKFGDSHAGFDIDVIEQDNRTFIIETSSSAEQKKYNNGVLSIYEYKDKKIEFIKSFNLNLDSNANQSKIMKHDIDHDGQIEIIVNKDKKRQFYKYLDGEWHSVKFKHPIQSQIGEWSNDIRLLVLENKNLGCSSIVSTLWYPNRKKPSFFISNCQ